MEKLGIQSTVYARFELSFIKWMDCIGTRHPLLCSAGYIYEEYCISLCWASHVTSPVSHQLTKFVRSMNIN